ncbi:MAG: DUF1345 domain-containing protein [Bifidobacterium psychraerophilum]|uniref:DUF1345 domain-containing protein n=1 Tax=Bifidobacterium psychraerophilum TaxID=218140 RepID=UPI0039E9E860
MTGLLTKGRRSTRRTIYMLVFGLLVSAIAFACGVGLPAATVIGWAGACAFYLCWVWGRIAGLDARQTRIHAAGEEPTRTTADVLLILSSFSSLAAVLLMILQAHGHGRAVLLAAVLTLCSLLLTWSMIHTLYMLRYAGIYYAETVGGIEFGGTQTPDYMDFAYMSFTMGMTFQVSDTALNTGLLRRTALAHTLLAYLFNTLVIGATVNLLAGLAAA